MAWNTVKWLSYMSNICLMSLGCDIKSDKETLQTMIFSLSKLGSLIQDFRIRDDFETSRNSPFKGRFSLIAVHKPRSSLQKIKAAPRFLGSFGDCGHNLTKPAVPSSTRLESLGLKLYPCNTQRMLNKDLTWFMQSLSRVCHNGQAKERLCW